MVTLKVTAMGRHPPKAGASFFQRRLIFRQEVKGEKELVSGDKPGIGVSHNWLVWL